MQAVMKCGFYFALKLEGTNLAYTHAKPTDIVYQK